MGVGAALQRGSIPSQRTLQRPAGIKRSGDSSENNGRSWAAPSPRCPQPSPALSVKRGHTCTGAQLPHALALGTSVRSLLSARLSKRHKPHWETRCTEITPCACSAPLARVRGDHSKNPATAFPKHNRPRSPSARRAGAKSWDYREKEPRCDSFFISQTQMKPQTRSRSRSLQRSHRGASSAS